MFGTYCFLDRFCYIFYLFTNVIIKSYFLHVLCTPKIRFINEKKKIFIFIKILISQTFFKEPSSLLNRSSILFK